MREKCIEAALPVFIEQPLTCLPTSLAILTCCIQKHSLSAQTTNGCVLELKGPWQFPLNQTQQILYDLQQEGRLRYFLPALQQVQNFDA